MNVSFALVPSSVIVSRLTSLFLTFALAANSAALLCSGTSGKTSTFNRCSLFFFVLPILSSSCSYPVLVEKIDQTLRTIASLPLNLAFLETRRVPHKSPSNYPEKLPAFPGNKALLASISCSFSHHESNKEHDDMQFA